MKKQFIPDTDARKSLANKLHLDYNDNMEDWEYEVSDINRLEDFVNQYLLSKTSFKEKESLMEVMIDSLNDSILQNKPHIFDAFAPIILRCLKDNLIVHKGTIDYWADGEFSISKIIKTEIQNEQRNY